MIVVDLNLLIYAVNRDAADHARARRWWESVLRGDETVGIPWVVVLGFLRIVTNGRIVPRPLPIERALGVVDGWLAQPPVVTLEPSDRHWSILRELLAPVGAAANLTTDAHLAALAIENGARLCSADRDFARFARLRWENPLAAR